MKNRVMEEGLEELRSEKNYLIKLSENHSKRGNGPEGTKSVGFSKKLEGACVECTLIWAIPL